MTAMDMPNAFLAATVRRTAGLITALTLAACGGGGGGSAPPPTGNPPPPPPPPPPGGGLVIDQNSADILPLSLDLSQTVLELGRTVIGPIVPFASPQGILVTDCANAGGQSLAYEDVDGNATVSPGDRFTLTYDQCLGGFQADEVTGTVTLELVTFDVTPTALSVELIVTLGADFEVTDGINRTVQFTGEFSVSLTHTDRFEDPEMLSVSATGAQFFAVSAGNNSETISEFTVSRQLGGGLTTPGGANITARLTYTLDYDSELLGGDAACTANQLDLGSGSTIPLAVDIVCTGANGTSVRIPAPDRFEFDASGGGSFSSLDPLEWSLVFNIFTTQSARFNLDQLVPDLPFASLIISAIDLVEDPTRDRVIALTDATDSNSPNALLALDPVARTVTPITTLPEAGQQVVVSPDGVYYYVIPANTGSPILRIDAATGTQSASIDFATDFAPRGTVFIVGLDVSPADSLTIAVALQSDANNGGDVIVIDDTTVRPNTLDDAGNVFLPSLLSNVLFTADGSELRVSANFLTTATLDANGVVSRTNTNIDAGTLRRLGAGQILSGGTALNADSLVQEGSYALVLEPVATLDASRFFIVNFNEVNIYQRDNYLLQGTYDLQTPQGSPLTSAAAQSDTLVVSDGNRVFLYELADLPVLDDGRCAVSTAQAEEGVDVLRVRCTTTDIAYDPGRDRLYIAVRGLRQAVVGNSVGILSFAAPSGIQYAPAGDDPRRIAMSSGGNELFVAFDDDHRIARLDLNSLTVTSRAPIPIGPAPFQTRADARVPLDIAPSPIVSTGLAFTFSTNPPVFDGIGYFQDGLLGTNIVSRQDLATPNDFGERLIEFEDTGELVTVLKASQSSVQRFTADATGVVLTSTADVPGFPMLPNEVSRLGALIYTAQGEVLDTVTGGLTQPFDLNLASEFGARTAVLADADTNSVFFLISNGDRAVVARYDLASGALIGTVSFPAIENFSVSYPAKIIKAGADRIAVFVSQFDGVAVIDVSDFE